MISEYEECTDWMSTRELFGSDTEDNEWYEGCNSQHLPRHNEPGKPEKTIENSDGSSEDEKDNLWFATRDNTNA